MPTQSSFLQPRDTKQRRAGWWVDIYDVRGSDDGGGDWAVVERKGGGSGTTARRRHGRAAGAWIAVDGRKKGSKGRKGRVGEK